MYKELQCAARELAERLVHYDGDTNTSSVTEQQLATERRKSASGSAFYNFNVHLSLQRQINRTKKGLQEKPETPNLVASKVQATF